ncbi:MAG TPA: hypothetical protein VFU22_08775 [Roseiflexaceae bacterium]|nr:hypothetical protein [Roseiflexaceae bacterium]
MLQNIYVAQDGGMYLALTDLTRERVAHSPSASATVQAAIDALAETGGEVRLGPGSFSLAGAIRLHDRIRLRGSGRGTRLVVGPTCEAGIGLLGAGAYGVVVSDLVLQPSQKLGGVAGIVLVWMRRLQAARRVLRRFRQLRHLGAQQFIPMRNRRLQPGR